MSWSMRSEIACFGCGQATFRLPQSGWRLAGVLACFAFGFPGRLAVPRAMLPLPRSRSALSIQAYRPTGNIDERCDAIAGTERCTQARQYRTVHRMAPLAAKAARR